MTQFAVLTFYGIGNVVARAEEVTHANQAMHNATPTMPTYIANPIPVSVCGHSIRDGTNKH